MPDERKRKATDNVDERPSKNAKVSSGSKFPGREMDPSQARTGFSSEDYFVGTIFMQWPVTKAPNGTLKMVLTCHRSTKLEVDIFDPSKVLSERLKIGKEVAVSLEGAVVSVKEAPTNSPDGSLLFKLVYPKGALLKLRGGGTDDALIDTREAPADIESDDWFSTPVAKPIDNALSEPLPVEQSASTSVKSSIDTNNAKRGRAATSSVPPAEDANPRTAQSAVPDAQQPTHQQAPANKGKRIRKKDTRHSANSKLRAASGQQKLKNKLENVEKKATVVAQEREVRAGGSKEAEEPDSPENFKAGFCNSRNVSYPSLSEVCSKLKKGNKFQLVGLVTEVPDAPKFTRTSEWMLRISVVDPSKHGTQESFGVNLFAKTEDALPAVKIGEVILLQQVKRDEFNDRPTATGYPESYKWAVYDPIEGKQYSKPRKGVGVALQMDKAELAYCLGLVEWWKALLGNGDISATQVGEKKKRQLLCLKDVEPDVFFDCIIRVVKIFLSDHSSDLYVTDYTSNPEFGDPSQSHNFIDGMALPDSSVMKITLWNEINNMRASFQDGAAFRLRNIRPRMSTGGRLEGTLGAGKDGVELVDRLRLEDEDAKQLRLNKIKFIKARNRTNGSSGSGLDTSMNDAASTTLHSKSTSGSEDNPDLANDVDKLAPEALICDMRAVQTNCCPAQTYCCIVEVLKKWDSASSHAATDLYVTDYTENPQLRENESNGLWHPPPGRRTLHVGVWDAEFKQTADILDAGAYVRFDNMSLHKIDVYVNGKIGLKLPKKCGIKILDKDDPSLRPLLRRKRRVMEGITEESPPSSPIDTTTHSQSTDVSMSILSQDEPLQAVAPDIDMKDDERATSLDIKPEPDSQQPLALPPTPVSRSPEARLSSSRQRQCRGPLKNHHMNQPRSSITDVLAEKDCPRPFRIRARVVGFFPLKMRDFVYQWCERCRVEIPNDRRRCIDCMADADDDIPPLQRWRFTFDLADKHGSRLNNVVLCDDDATAFLANLPAENLWDRPPPPTLASLRARLDPLIGNLEEVHKQLLEAMARYKGKRKERPGEKLEVEVVPVEHTPGEWADWCVRSWMEGDVKRYGVFGCEVVVE